MRVNVRIIASCDGLSEDKMLCNLASSAMKSSIAICMKKKWHEASKRHVMK